MSSDANPPEGPQDPVTAEAPCNALLRHPLSELLPDRPTGSMQAPARVLGWMSIGMGLVGVLLPRLLCRSTQTYGGRRATAMVRGAGLRNLGVGAGLLLSKNPTPWLWGRVAGDVMDIGVVATGMANGMTDPLRGSAVLGLLGGLTVVEASCSRAAKPKSRATPDHDYTMRTGFAKPVEQMRGAAVGVTAASSR